MRAFILFFAAGLAIAQAPAPYQPVGTMSQLMVDIIYPASDAIFYVDRDAPKNAAQWNALQGTALTLAESGNLLMMEGRARDQGDWMKDSKMMVDAGAAAYKAARARSLDGLLAVNDQLYQACVTCHQQYRPGYGKRR
jgi:hypothetical protein